MRVVHIAYSMNPDQTDPEAWLKRIGFFTGILEQMANHCEVFHINFLGINKIIKKNGVVHAFFNVRGLGFYFPLSVHSYIRKLNPDVVVVHGLRSPLQVLLLRSQLGGKVKFVIQNHAEQPLKGTKAVLQKFVDPFISAYFFSSLDQARPWKETKQIQNLDKVHEVMEVSSMFYPISKDEASKKIYLKTTKNYLWVGRLDKNKDPLLVIHAFLNFLDHGGDGTLYLIFQSNDLLGDVQASLIKSNHSGKIKLVGKVAHDELLYWFNSVDFILSTSHYEGSGVAVCEAMSCGCIPILSDIPSFRMMTNNGSCGLLFEKGNGNALTDTLLKSRTLDMHQERQKTLDQFDKKLSFRAIADTIYSVIIC